MSEPGDSTKHSPEPRPLVERTIERWTGTGENNAHKSLEKDSADSKEEWDAQRGRPRSFWRRRAMSVPRGIRFTLGITKPTASEPPTRWVDYLVDFLAWAVIIASCGALVYVLYHGLALFGFISPR